MGCGLRLCVSRGIWRGGGLTLEADYEIYDKVSLAAVFSVVTQRSLHYTLNTAARETSLLAVLRKLLE